VSEADTETTITDGRRLRSQDSKRKIVAAMLELVREGSIAPTAEEVAQRAHVGLRTVFRRFKDMESLYAEMSVAISEKVAPVVNQELNDSDWRHNFVQLLDRRLQVYEIIRPYRVASDALRFQSDILRNRHRQIVSDERERLIASLPDFVLQDATLIEGLNAVISFDMWNQLRDDQKLDVTQAAGVVYRLVSRLLPELGLRD
jgi:AcrR family transcriptional regulator